MVRVQKLLANWGHCSRRKAEALIEQGRVKVNDKVIKLGDQASETDKILVDGERVEQTKKVYLLLNKPLGFVTAVSDRHEKTIMQFLPDDLKVFPIGRLDKQTSGALLLTNDGDWANRIAHPRFEIEKEYEIVLNRRLEKNDLKQCREKIHLDDGVVKLTHIKVLKPDTIRVVLHIGKNRIVRRIFEHFGYRIKRLKRLRVGRYELGNLKMGQIKEIDPFLLDK